MVGVYNVSRWSWVARSAQGESRSQERKKLNIHVISDGITRLPILEGEISHIEIPRGRQNLGITIVGGADTPLRCVVVQEVFPEGLAGQDGRLKAGDQIIEVNSCDMTSASHQEVCDALRNSQTHLQLGVYRERIEAYKSSSLSHGERNRNDCKSGFTQDTFTVTLERECGRQIGIKLTGLRSKPGVYIADVLEGSLAAQDGGFLQYHDRILSINGKDVKYASVAYANSLINESFGELKITLQRHRSRTYEHLDNMESSGYCISSSASSDSFSDSSPASSMMSSPRSRESRGGNSEPRSFYDNEDLSNPRQQEETSCCPPANTPCHCPSPVAQMEEEPWPERDYIQESPPVSCVGQESRISKSANSSIFPRSQKAETTCRLKAAHVVKASKEPLGMRIGGGMGSNEGDTPIYVANVNPNGPVGKTKNVQIGDILLSVNGQTLFGLSHEQAAILLKSTGDQKGVSLTLLSGSETSTGLANFVPSWLYWQNLPRSLQISKTVVLRRDPGCSLGFSIVGGKDPQKGDGAIHVLYVVETSPAATQGRVRCGDRLLAVDGHSLEHVPHAVAVMLLKQAGERVHLELVSWLGTEI